MPRGGLPKDPAKKKAALDRLAEGREIARARRAAGLPTKRREAEQARVKPGRRASSSAPASQLSPAAPASSSTRKPKPRQKARQSPGKDPAKPLNAIERGYARLLGYGD